MATTTTRGLTKTQAKKYKKLLDEKAQELRASLQSTRAGKGFVGEQTSNLEDLPVQSHEEWIFLNRNSIDMMLLREIHDALARIDEGDYGVCGECDEAISQKRLQAVPWARHCVACQEELAELEKEREARSEGRR